MGINQVDLRPMGKISITFECQPFAESLDYLQVTKTITNNPDSIPLTVNGTANTSCIITIKNIGTTDIKDIVLTRKAKVK